MNKKHNKVTTTMAIVAMLLMQPSLAYYGICLLFSKLVLHILMTPIYIIILTQSLILAWKVIRRKEVS